MSPRDRKSLFVARPFKGEYEPVVSTVRDAARLLGMDVVDLNEERYVGSIISRIRKEIQEADVVVAIATEENGNVYYEIGLAHCQQKPVAILTTDPESLKFDLRDHRAIRYDPDAPDRIRDELVSALHVALSGFNEPGAYFENIFRSQSKRESVHQGVKKAMLTLQEEFDLTEPVRVMEVHQHSGGEVAIAVRDFLGAEVRAVCDINGVIRTMKRM